MNREEPASFEGKLARIEEIVRELETGNVKLDRAIELFKEGKTLTAECETLLRTSQQQIDAANDAPPR